ncbi:MAG: GGDEF domain-containing protein [Wenzhouxiangellaceae bacterium]|nr:GGDEF domain-containing protein [Wenzhouxiangellaceae bacterium]
MLDQDHDLRLRRTVLVGILAVTALVLPFFIVYNYQRGLVLAASLEVLLVIYALVLIRFVRRTRHLRWWALAYMLPLVMVMLTVMAQPNSANTIFIWILLLPLSLHFLLGSRVGLALSIVALAGACVIALSRFGLPQTAEQMVLTGNLAAVSLLTLFLSYLYEQGRERAAERMRTLANTDRLTGLANRMPLDETWARMSALARRHQQPLTLMLLDLDEFKAINDRYGHVAGDRALVVIGTLLRERFRRSDFICRQGGEEFLVLMPETTHECAFVIAEDLRQRTETTTIESGTQRFSITLSIGIAEITPDDTALDDLLRRADRRLYAAKQQGRNQVVSDDATPVASS